MTTRSNRSRSKSRAISLRRSIALNCHVGCDYKDIISHLGIELKENGSRLGHESAVYRYTDENGGVLFKVVRYVSKNFRQRTPDGKWSVKGVRRVPYRLDKVIDAIKRDETVYIVEGEEDVHALEKKGFTATTNPGGAGKWRDEYSSLLKGAKVVIIPDNDEPGKKHARKVAASVQRYVLETKVLELPDLDDKGDVRDWFRAGYGRFDLEELAKIAKPEESDRTTSTVGDFVSAADIAKEPPPEPIIEDIVYRNWITVLVGESGAGESFVVTDIAAAVFDGFEWQGRGVVQGSSCYVAFEADALQNRVQALQMNGRELKNLYILRAMDPLSPVVQRGEETVSVGEQILCDRLGRLAEKLETAGRSPITLLSYRHGARIARRLRG